MATCELITEPTELPITLAQLKAHLQEVSDDQDEYLKELLKRSLDDAAGECSLAGGVGTYRYKTDRFPSWPQLTGEEKPITLPRGPAVSLTSVKYFDEDDAEQTMPSTDYWFDAASGRIQPKTEWPDTMPGRPGAVTVLFTAGYTAANVPKKFVQAVLLIAANHYRHRGDDDKGIAESIPLAASRLLWQLWEGGI